MKKTHTTIEKDSTEAEWTELRCRLENLREQQIRLIAERIGLKFSGNSPVTKEQYIDILDEAYWDELAEAYRAIVGKEL